MSDQTASIVETRVHVRYAETDAMGVVHHAAYLVYFEEGRSHYMREMGSNTRISKPAAIACPSPKPISVTPKALPTATLSSSAAGLKNHAADN